LENKWKAQKKPEAKYGTKKRKIGFYIGIGTAVGAGVGAAIEIRMETPRIKDLIIKKEIGFLKEAMKKGEQEGVQTFDQAIYNFYMEGKISYETAIAYADSANDLRLRIKFDTPGQEEEEAENKPVFKI